ncbi:MAG: AraC-like DNA-binding protein [Devosia sp.]
MDTFCAVSGHVSNDATRFDYATLQANNIGTHRLRGRSMRPVQTVSLRAGDFDPAVRVDAFKEAVAAICRLDFTPADPARFQSETSIGVLPTLVTGHGAHSSCKANRTVQLAADAQDNVMVHLPLQGGFTMQQVGGQSIECAPGMIYVDPNEVPGEVSFHGDRTDVFYVSIPRGVLAPATKGLNALMRNGAALTPQWRLFARYARMLHEELGELPPDQALICASHVHDLALMALEGETAHGGHHGGVKAARLTLIKSDIEDNLSSPRLSPGWIAGRHGISERYLRSLFASQDTSFQDHVCKRRLLAAYRRLSDPRHVGQSISQIALDVGFGDLSWFNAQFKRNFGHTPSELRARTAV